MHSKRSKISEKSKERGERREKERKARERRRDEIAGDIKRFPAYTIRRNNSFTEHASACESTTSPPKHRFKSLSAPSLSLLKQRCGVANNS
jgi:hypothetical protein